MKTKKLIDYSMKNIYSFNVKKLFELIIKNKRKI